MSVGVGVGEGVVKPVIATLAYVKLEPGLDPIQMENLSPVTAPALG